MTMDEQAAQSRRYVNGDVIGDKYRLVRRLDEGGMGDVWIARHRDLDMHVAIKLVRHELASLHAAQHLLDEARIVARLEHPGIVRVTDVGITRDADAFIVMELLHGESLAELIQRRGTLDEVRAAEILLPVADALALAHDSGVVHRDLKPENVFLAELANGRLQPKILDFGIALSAREASALSTIAGAVVGSPGYMSPEQARGLAEIDGRSDVWAFSVVLYEAISGALPFEGDDYAAMLRAIVEDEPLPLTGLVDCDPAIWAIVRRGLRKHPSDRWRSMRELGCELARWMLSRGVQKDATGTSLHSVWPDVDAAQGSLRPVVVVPSTPPASPVEQVPRTVQLTTHGHAAVAVARPSATRARFSVAAVLFGVLLGAGAIALVGTLRESPEGYARVGAPATPPEPPATPPEPPATPPAVAQADIVEAPVVPEAKSEPKPNESSAELAPAVAADAGVMVKDRAAPRAPKRAKPAPAASSYRPRDL